MKNITFRQLRVFVEAAKQLSFARAAEHLHLTPPAISMQIKELEASVGLPLFDRSGRTVSLTTVGEYYVIYARRILATVKEAEDAMAHFSGLQTGVLTVGVVSTASYFVPPLLRRFHQDHQGIEVRLTVAQNRDQMYAQLGANEIDVAIMGRPPREMNTRSETFAAHPFVFICPAGHPVQGAGHPPLQLLEDYPFLMRENGSGTRSAMQAFFEDHDFNPHLTMQMTSNETIKQAVVAGLGLSFLSLHTLGLELKTGALEIVHIPDTPVMRLWNIVHMRSRILSPAAEAFRYFMLENAEQFLAAEDASALR